MSEGTPSVSVIMPCYNGMPFVIEAVRSVLDQADEGVELVVVDDGSTDRSGDALEENYGGRIRLVRQKNAGPSAARNRGWAESRGELVIWFDADDLMEPGTMPLRRQPFAEDPALEMLVGRNHIFDMDTGNVEISPLVCEKDYLVKGLLARRNLPHLNIMTFRRSAVERIGVFNPRYPVSQDFDLWIRAWAFLRWRFTETILSQQRIGTFPSVSRRRGKVFAYRDTGRVLFDNRGLFRRVLGSDDPWREGYAGWAADFALLNLLHGNRRSAFVWSARAIALLRGAAPIRTYKFFLESLLSTPLYDGLSRSVGFVKRFVGARGGK